MERELWSLLYRLAVELGNPWGGKILNGRDSRHLFLVGGERSTHVLERA